MSPQQKTIPELMSDLVGSVNRLVRKELQLARAESADKLSEAMTGVISLAAGMLVALTALLVLVQALVVALAELWDQPALASLVVGVVLAIIAFVLVRKGQKNLRPSELALPKTTAELRRDKDLVMETVR